MKNENNKTFRSVYKCRCCGQKFKGDTGGGVHPCTTALKQIVYEDLLGKPGYETLVDTKAANVFVPKIIIHEASDHIGLADLLGYEEK